MAPTELLPGSSALAFGGFAALTLSAVRAKSRTFDALRWLEEVDSDRALGWVREQNAANPFRGEGPQADQLKTIFDSKEKIPFVSKVNGMYYNFWKDDKQERGIWRKTTLEEFRKADPKWETVIDLDALCAADGEKWVWAGAAVIDLGPDQPRDRALISLSPGGGDAVHVREFDMVAETFLGAEAKPFVLPAAKTTVSYKDRDTVLVSTDFGPGSLTTSGYPRVVKEWRRGTPLAEAKTVFAGDASDVSVYGSFMRERGGCSYQLTRQRTGFYTTRDYLHVVEGVETPEGEPVAVPAGAEPILLPLPDDASADFYADQVLIELRSEWKGFSKGSLLAAAAHVILRAKTDQDIDRADLTALFRPTERVALRDYTKTRSLLVLGLLDNINSRLEALRYEGAGRWVPAPAPVLGDGGISTVDCWAVESKMSDLLWATTESFTEPTTLSIVDATGGAPPDSLKREQARFPSAGLEVAQHEATSLDGTKVPYFQVSSAARKGSPGPTLLYGYGGFEISLKPGYQITTGVCWLAKGFTYVCANIRGGGEFGPQWHQAALKANRNKAYEDFEAVAKDLVARGVTTHRQLGAMGGSNGGLLMGNMLTRSPDLFGGIVCMVPLLDMKRYSKLLAGASWMAEYGDPDTADWENFLHKFSPYHNLSASRKYPPILFTTSTRDDRVHPGHARKMAKKMLDMGCKDVFYWENIEGGHGGSSTNGQRAQMWAVAYEFLEHVLSDQAAR